jgi:hypothetical protein
MLRRGHRSGSPLLLHGAVPDAVLVDETVTDAFHTLWQAGDYRGDGEVGAWCDQSRSDGCPTRCGHAHTEVTSLPSPGSAP